MTDDEQAERKRAEEAFLRTRTDAELDELAACLPIIANDASNPSYAFRKELREELTRRNVAKRRAR